MGFELNFIFGLVILGLWCSALRIATESGMILERVCDYAERLPKWLFKPLIGCVFCMASIHGTVLYFTYFNIGLIYWPLFCICGIAVNGFVYFLIEKLRG